MLSVILLSMIIILLSNLSAIRHLICGSDQSFCLNLNLTYRTLWIGGGRDLLMSMLDKLSLCHLSGVLTLVLLMWKWMVLFLKGCLLKCWGYLFLLNGIGTLTASLLEP